MKPASCPPCCLHKLLIPLDGWTTLYKNLDGTDTNYEADGAGGRKCAKTDKYICHVHLCETCPSGGESSGVKPSPVEGAVREWGLKTGSEVGTQRNGG